MGYGGRLGSVYTGTSGSIADIIVELINLREHRPAELAADLFRAFGRKTVLVTGAAGTIGSSIIEHLWQLPDCKHVVMVDHDDSRLNDLYRRSPSAHLGRPILCDIRDGDVLKRHIASTRPDVIVHCAAIKHVDLAEMYPDEAFRTNVGGTFNLLDACRNSGTVIVNISTDKAATAVNVLGRTKRQAEQLCALFDLYGGLRARSFRLGNVLNSRGSVLDVFHRRAVQRQPLIVTNPAMQRFYMTLEEVMGGIARLVDEPFPLASCLVPALGRPLRVAEIVECFAKHFPDLPPTSLVGSRPGEALAEALIGETEVYSADVVLPRWMNIAVLGRSCVKDDLLPTTHLGDTGAEYFVRKMVARA